MTDTHVQAWLKDSDTLLFSDVVTDTRTRTKAMQKVIHRLICEKKVKHGDLVSMSALNQHSPNCRPLREKVEVRITPIDDLSYKYQTSLNWAETIYMVAERR